MHGADAATSRIRIRITLMPYSKNAKRSLLAKAILAKKRREASVIPPRDDERASTRPEVLHKGDPRFDDMVSFMDWSSDGFAHKFIVEGDG